MALGPRLFLRRHGMQLYCCCCRCRVAHTLTHTQTHLASHIHIFIPARPVPCPINPSPLHPTTIKLLLSHTQKEKKKKKRKRLVHLLRHRLCCHPLLDGSSACTHKVQKFRRNLSIRIFLDLSQRFCVHTGSRQRTHFIFFLLPSFRTARGAYCTFYIFRTKPACLKIYCASRTFTSLMYICFWHSEFGTGGYFGDDGGV